MDGFMTKARGDSMDALEVEIHHVWSRVVQRAMLLGVDPLTLIDYAGRRCIVEQLIKYQAGVFAVDVANYSVMGNHLHAILRSRPDIVANWSDEECAFRYKSAWPTWLDASEEVGPTYADRVYHRQGIWDRVPSDQAIECLLDDEETMARIRIFLGSISGFMARVKEPLARLFNKECDVNGSYWAKRFGNRKLESHEEIIGGNFYVDLNHVRANAALSLEESRCSGIRLRLMAERARQEWIEENTATSLERIYQDRVNGSTDVPVDQLNSMFADAWLVPITADAPLDADDQAEIIREEAVYEERIAREKTSSSPDPMSDSSSYDIWKRRHERLRRRKSNKALFDTSWHSYRQNVLALAAASICEQVPQADPQALTDRLAESPPEAAGDLIYEVVDWRTTIGDIRRELRQFIWAVSGRIRDAFGGSGKGRDSKVERDNLDERDATEPSVDAKPSGKPPPPRLSGK
jgi:hypothetical protein